MSEILSKIDKAGHIVVISHVDPDADTLGSASAMYTFLLQKHKKVSWFCKNERVDNRFSCIPWYEKIKSSFAFSADLAISFDCADKNRVGTEYECELINIDHHLSRDEFGTLNLVYPDAISTTEILYRFFKDNDIKINKKMATALYAGILEDSKGFLSQKTDGMTFAIVKELIELGADFKNCNDYLMKRVSLAALKLKSLMFKNMYLLNDAKIAFFCITKEDMKSTGAQSRDCEAALEESLYLDYVKVAILLEEREDLIKGSIRSKPGVDAAKIACCFGGGGHVDRAGFNVGLGSSLKNMKYEILNLIKKDM